MPEDVQTYAARVAAAVGPDAAFVVGRLVADLGGAPSVADRPRRSESERERLRRISILNARLPKKRTIAQGVLRNPPARCCSASSATRRSGTCPAVSSTRGSRRPPASSARSRRSSASTVTAGRLLAVNWLPPWRGWDDALLYLFDLGVHETGELDPALFLRREIAGAHWRAVEDAAAHVAPYTARMLEVAHDAEHTAYLENSEPVGG